MASRRSRFAKVFPRDREAIEEAAAKLRDAMRNAKLHLVPFNEQYSALHRLGDEIRIALNVINDRPPDHQDPMMAQVKTQEGDG